MPLLQILFFGIANVLFAYYILGGHVSMDVDVVLDESVGRGWYAITSNLILRY